MGARLTELEAQLELMTKRKTRKRKQIQKGSTLEYSEGAAQVAAEASAALQPSKKLVVGRVKIGLNELYSAVGTVGGQGIMREHARQIQQNFLSLRRVLSIYFQIVLIIVQTIQKVKIVALRNFSLLSSLAYLVV